MLGRHTVIILSLLIISILLGCSGPASAPSTAIKGEFTSAEELLSEINRLNSNISPMDFLLCFPLLREVLPRHGPVARIRLMTMNFVSFLFLIKS